MKVIDLLNKKANGEELPSEINCYNQTFYLSDGIYIAENQVGKYFEDYFDFSSLDYEIEIIEDKPKKIDKIQLSNGGLTIHTGENNDYTLSVVHKEIIKKINEIIEKVNGEE